MAEKCPSGGGAPDGIVRYSLEADVSCKGNRFYPDSHTEGLSGLRVDFATGGVTVGLELYGGGGNADHFGADAYQDGTPIKPRDYFWLTYQADLQEDGSFLNRPGSVQMVADGFFKGLSNFGGSAEGGGFFFGESFEDGVPPEAAGVFSLFDDDGEELTGGFLGKKD